MHTHTEEITVMFGHCDKAGIVFYPHCYVWFDNGTEKLFTANGLSYAALSEEYDSPGMPLLETGTTYEAASRLGDVLTFDSWVDEWQRKTFVVRHRATHPDGRMAFEGFERRVWIKRDADAPVGFRAVEIPDDVKRRFEA